MITKDLILAKLNEGISLSRSEKFAYRNMLRTLPPIAITDNANQIIIGSLLGDGSIVRKSTNCIFTINHSLVQKDYLLYKKELLEKEGLCIKHKELQHNYGNSVINGRLIKDNGQIRLYTQQNVAFNKYRDEWYNPKKEVPDSIYELNALGLAIWYMDDGTYHYPTGLYLSTNGFNHESQLKLVDMLQNNFDIKANIHKNKDKEIIYIAQKSKEPFLNIIKPYVCNSMNYKIIGHNK